MSDLRFFLKPLPDLVPYKPHSQRAQIEELSDQWTRQHLGPYFSTTEVLEGFLEQRLALWPGMCYPSATPERLLTICKWNHFWFFMDDKSMHKDRAAHPDRMDATFAPLRHIADGHPRTPPTGIPQIFANLWQEFTDTMPERLTARFRADLNTMLDGFQEEAELRAAGHIDAAHLDDLIDARIKAAGMSWCFDLSEYSLGIDLTEEIERSTELQEARRLAIYQTTVLGEIFSFRKEHFGGDEMNAITALTAQGKYSLQEAVDIVHDLASTAERDFVSVCDTIRNSGLGQQPHILDYLSEVSHQIAGVTRWQLISPRYHGPRHAWDGRMTGHWTLLPDATVTE